MFNLIGKTRIETLEGRVAQLEYDLSTLRSFVKAVSDNTPHRDALMMDTPASALYLQTNAGSIGQVYDEDKHRAKQVHISRAIHMILEHLGLRLNVTAPSSGKTILEQVEESK